MGVASKAGAEAWREMLRLVMSRHAHARMQAASSAAGLPPSAVKALAYLDPERGAPLHALAEHWSCDPSFVTGVADALEDRGFARRLPNPADRRAKILELTETGIAARTEVLSIFEDPPAAFAALTPDEQRELRDLVRKLADADSSSPDRVTVGSTPRH